MPSRGGHVALPGLRAAAALAAPGAVVFLLGLELGGYSATAWSTAIVGALATGTLVVVRRRAVRLSVPVGIGNAALKAAARGDAREARLAVRMQPWSAQPQRLLAELLIARGRREEGAACSRTRSGSTRATSRRGTTSCS